MAEELKVLSEPQAIELLIRIDERTQEMKESIKAFEAVYVTHKEFAPVKVIAYGLVGLCMTGIVGALLMLVFKVK